MSFGEKPYFDSPNRAHRPSIAPSTPGYDNDDMVRSVFFLKLWDDQFLEVSDCLIYIVYLQGFMNGLPNIGGIGSPGMGLGFCSVHLT
jgi:hypothetical protein